MPRLQRKSLRVPDEVRRFPNGWIDLVSLDETVIGNMHFEPGWRWSKDVAPIAGTSSCQNRHVGVIISGRLHVAMDDGSTMELGPDDAYEIPPGHDGWVMGDERLVTVEFASSRIFAQSPQEVGERVLATILFTDIVGSTQVLERIGDAAWRELLLAHNQRMRAEIDNHRGRELEMTGDGFMAVFDGAGRGVRCGMAMARAAAGLGIDIRAGAHTGELDLVAGKARGLAVHTAARVMALAGPGEVLISSTTRDLLAGSGLELEYRGTYELKGLSGPRDVFRVVGSPP